MPISEDRRISNYRKQSGRKDPTPRQRRRLSKKKAAGQRRSRS